MMCNTSKLLSDTQGQIHLSALYFIYFFFDVFNWSYYWSSRYFRLPLEQRIPPNNILFLLSIAFVLLSGLVLDYGLANGLLWAAVVVRFRVPCQHLFMVKVCSNLDATKLFQRIFGFTNLWIWGMGDMAASMRIWNLEAEAKRQAVTVKVADDDCWTVSVDGGQWALNRQRIVRVQRSSGRLAILRHSL